jgi:hypothetical protein
MIQRPLLLKKKRATRLWSTNANAMSTQLDDPSPFEASRNEDDFFQQSLPEIYRKTLTHFRRITTSCVLFHLLFATLLAAELVFFFSFISLLLQSTLLAISLSGIFLTVFSYSVLLFYYQAKKPEQLILLKNQFLASSRQILSLPIGEREHHLSISVALTKLASYLEDYEWHFYRLPRILTPFHSLLSRVSAFVTWQDVFRFKQILLHAAIDEHIAQIRLTPTDLEIHASLATTYIALSRLFLEPEPSSVALKTYQKKQDSFKENFRIAAELAIEEFQILSSYAPNDPWVHEQLAAGYRDLQMPTEEVGEIETLLRLKPDAQELLCRLGALYFSQGFNAKGLRVYEDLKRANYKKAEDLITAYGKNQGRSQACEIL